MTMAAAPSGAGGGSAALKAKPPQSSSLPAAPAPAHAPAQAATGEVGQWRVGPDGGVAFKVPTLPAAMREKLSIKQCEQLFLYAAFAARAPKGSG